MHRPSAHQQNVRKLSEISCHLGEAPTSLRVLVLACAERWLRQEVVSPGGELKGNCGKGELWEVAAEINT